ncbi:hypothetical protein BCR44DRAFT_26502 [Catenaria anguillulae PL171]|uniref:Uncharacterized protein n=1 Tax=Catenaria anguillulae PL171 TaxID=765915 RepID=A0A1Y2I176_9FUNG|nr:hypothetical protein BCR44DRAFT_26502 [Catenaria anguillulae PL171]
MSTDTPASLIPPEIWIRVMPLVHKSSITRVLSSSAFFASLSRSAIVHTKWTEICIFESIRIPQDVSFQFKMPGRPVDHHIARLLKALLPIALLPGGRPCFASLIAPANPKPDPIFTSAYIDWLFKKGGPLYVASPLPRQRLEEKLVDFVTRKGKSVYHDPLNVDQTKRDSRWMPIPDALLLLMYSIRSGQPTLLARILPHVLRLIPKDTSLSSRIWSHYLLDNRRKVVYSLVTDLDASQQDSLSFSMFLYWLVAIEWSAPMLAAVDSKLGERALFLDMFFNKNDGFFLFLLTKTAPLWEEPRRVVEVIRYLQLGRKPMVVIAALMLGLFVSTVLTLIGVVLAAVAARVSRLRTG